jgi:hypothetical protein
MSELELTAIQREALRACLHAPPSTGFYRRALALDDQVERFVTYLSSLSAFAALTKAGIWSRDFWLKP